MMLRLRSIHIHPIKSHGGFAVPQARLTDRGLEHDRRWMLVDANDRFVSQRERPMLACLCTSPGANGFRVRDVRTGDHLDLPWSLADGPTLSCRVWDDTVRTIAAPDAWNAWFRGRTGTYVRLVYMPDDSHRPTDPTYADAITSLSDGFPYLIASMASLDELNRRLHASGTAPVPMDRFRPNLVVEGGTPFQEDAWGTLMIGDVLFRAVKPCSRCVITTTDQRTGERGPEPLRTLATFRRQGHRILFGVNAVAGTLGTITAGDAVVPQA
jgi:uncharacterized protein YcbX